ncbi:TrkA family potassium uptake protein [Candidatus Woesearchaeota archaeon]|nr:TrkA family potassium uptake protein [Candidatus Woesearchaeota archaeon]
MSKNYGVIGMGRFGRSIALSLEKFGQNVMAFDKDPANLESVKDYVTLARILDATNKEALRESGITGCDTVIVSMGDAVEASFLIVLSLKELGVKTIIAKASTTQQGAILEKIGASKVVYPERESAIRLASQLTSSDILEFLEVSPDYQVAEFMAPSQFVGNSLENLELQKEYHVLILAIRRKNKIIGIPSGKEKINDSDILVAVGQTKEMSKFLKRWNVHKKISMLEGLGIHAF